MSKIRHYFEDREQLSTALIQRYIARLKDALGKPNETGSLDSLIAIWSASAVEDDRMCLCSLYGAEISALPPDVATQTRRYFETVNDWIASTLKCEGNSQHSEAILSSLCGALLTVQALGQPEQFTSIATKLIEPVLSECKSDSEKERRLRTLNQ